MLSIIPVPLKCKELEGRFQINEQTKLLYTKGTPKGKMVAENFALFLAGILGVKPEVAMTEKSVQVKNAILLTTAGDTGKLGEEGYRLTVRPNGALIRANKPAGLFYGLQSLRQLLPAGVEAKDGIFKGKLVAPCVNIEDAPRFKWRGMHYDPCRRFYGREHVFEYIDFLAMHKFNVLHFHLTEDQGWRIEIKKYPGLSEVSAWRNGTKKPHETDSKPSRKKHGGYYTQDDIRAIVKYAAERFITVLPEIELPGHAQAAIAAYPQFSCTGGSHKVMTRWGVSKDVYCAGNDGTFKFLEDVLEEVIELFPSRYIHIGGDECPKDRWKKCPKCQVRIKKEGLSGENELQSYFIRRIEKFINSKGRAIIGWDEILEGGLAPNATVMSWRGCEGGWQAAAQGHDVVMTPCEYTYFNFRPAAGVASGANIILPLEKVYSFEPEEGFKPEAKKHVLGGQGAMWSEFLDNSDEFNLHLFPRLCAMSEVLWSARKSRDYRAFLKRVKKFVKRLDAMGVTCFKDDI